MSIPKLIEDAVTMLLREELEKRGVKALPVSIRTPQGHRKPDLLCENAGIYPIEAKFRENDLTKAIAKIQNDYIKFYKYLGIKGGFAILYPEELSKPMPLEAAKDLAYKLKFKVVEIFPPEDKRNFNVYEGSLIEVADEIAKHVLTPPEYVEPSVEYIIKVLRDSATYITEALKHLTGKQLEDLFGGKHVFKNILQYEEGKYPVESLRLASAYLLVNQLLFYHVLSRRIPRKFPELDPDTIEHPADLNKYFKKVLDVNYRAVLSYDVASRIPQKYLDQVKMIVNVIQGLSPEKIGGDLLGTIFHDLVPFEVRKTVAAFYTNVLVAELLAWLAIDRYDAKVADFACGSGGLLVASYRRKRYLLERERPFTQEDHRRFVEEELLGVDVMPFAANVAACHLALQSPQYFTNKVNIAIWDSTELSPGRTIPSIASLKYVLAGQTNLEMFTKSESEVKGVVSLTGEKPEEIKLVTYDVVIMNPPFTRFQRIPKEYKRILWDRFKEYKDLLDSQMGYYGFFILLADKFLKEEGRMALVLPSTFLSIKSLRGVRKLLAEKYFIEYVITTTHRAAFSESAKFREILLVARKTRTVGKTKIVVLKELPNSLETARNYAHIISKFRENYEDDNLLMKIVDYRIIKNNWNNWLKYIPEGTGQIINLIESLIPENIQIQLGKLVNLTYTQLINLRFKDFIAYLTRKDRAMKKVDVWVIEDEGSQTITVKNRFTDRKVKVPVSALGKGLRRLSGVNLIDVTNVSDYLILKWFDQLPTMLEGIVNTRDIPNFKPEVVEQWAKVYERKKCKVLIARRFDFSATGTHLTAFYCDSWIVGPHTFWCARGISGDDAKILTLWFNSIFGMAQLLFSRRETRGAFIDLDKYKLATLIVPDPRKLSKNIRMKFLNLFNSLRTIRWPSILDQLERRYLHRMALDKTILSAFGYRGDIDALLDQLYDIFAQEIRTLKELMRGK